MKLSKKSNAKIHRHLFFSVNYFRLISDTLCAKRVLKKMPEKYFRLKILEKNPLFTVV